MSSNLHYYYHYVKKVRCASILMATAYMPPHNGWSSEARRWAVSEGSGGERQTSSLDSSAPATPTALAGTSTPPKLQRGVAEEPSKEGWCGERGSVTSKGETTSAG